MLASDEDGGTLDALKFSLASEIVELVVLTGDEAFLQTLREAVGGARRVWHVPSPDKVSDLLVAGEVGIVVLDVQTLHDGARIFVQQIKRQFPDLVLVAAGHRDDESSLAGLISAGLVYRFIHKPMSPARAKLFAEAAIRKYDSQRLRASEAPQLPQAPNGRAWLIGGGLAAVVLLAALAWITHRNGTEEAALAPAAETVKPAATQSPLLTRAAAALAANRLTEPPGDNALDLYLQLQARNPADASVSAGLAEVHERLLARAENALLEERLDEAAVAIETARKSGVESGRIAFLSAQLAKSREQVKLAQSPAPAAPPARARAEAKAEADRVTPLIDLAKERIADGRLLEPDHDSAGYYVQEALGVDPQNPAALEAKRILGGKILEEARSAVDRRDFARTQSLLAAAAAVAVPANIEAVQNSLNAARKQADADAKSQLLKNANERLLQDRLIEPANDNAKYFYLTLKQMDPGNPALAALLQDLGTRLTAKARRALILGQLDAAKSWLDEAGSAGFGSADLGAAQHDLDAAVAKQNFMTNLFPEDRLSVVRAVQPIYPNRAISNKIEGWVEVQFTVAENGKVKDVAVKASSISGVFEDAAVRAVSDWRFKPVLRDAKPVAVRSEIRVRFTLP
ncbi:MAG TPA: TonB family protein [Steroidobacteraceae bacterium]|nr:TonB family protein [Steroidobacteraceae bacterium]